MATVLITGTSRGIGRATALEIGRAGHTVCATMRDPARSPELAELAEEEGLSVHVSRMDVDSDTSVRDGVQQIERKHGPIDVLVNNAGVGRKGSVEELEIEDFRAVMETNYFGALRCIKAVLPSMRERRSGQIINISSIAGQMPFSPLAPYSASKAALESLSETLAQEVAAFGIRVAIVQPGVIATDMPQVLTDPGSSRYSQERRVAAMFTAALSQGSPPSVVGEVIRDLVDGETTRIRHPAGPGAAEMLAWRSSLTTEQWVDWWGVENDEDWYDAYERDLGADIRPGAGS